VSKRSGGGSRKIEFCMWNGLRMNKRMGSWISFYSLDKIKSLVLLGRPYPACDWIAFLASSCKFQSSRSQLINL
jgi:hypothetical protein